MIDAYVAIKRLIVLAPGGRQW